MLNLKTLFPNSIWICVQKPQGIVLQLFTTLACQHLECSMQLWSPQLQKDTAELEKGNWNEPGEGAAGLDGETRKAASLQFGVHGAGRDLQDMTEVYSLPSWLYKGNAELLFAKLQNIRTMGNSVKPVRDNFKTDEGKLLHRMGSEPLELAATAVGKQVV